MLHWIPYPMVRIAIFFAAGILAGIYFPWIDHTWLATLAVGLLCFLGLLFRSDEHRFPALAGALALSTVFLLGFLRLVGFNELNSETHFATITKPIVAYEAELLSVPEEKRNSWKVEVKMIAVKTTPWQRAEGKVLLYISKSNFNRSQWHYGDRILVKGSPQAVHGPANPGEFDFKRFLSFRDIGHQQVVESGDVRIVAPALHKGLMYYSYEARRWSIDKINQVVHGDNERAVATALILGVTEGIDNDLLNAYAASGAMHLLAVSGMHVGIIYAIILFLCKPLNRWRRSAWVIAGISVLVLWAFAYVTALSPSVLRAVTMFSFIAVARPFGKRTNLYNTMAASAFVLLLFNPYLILSVGFQLSYLAVLGIVYLQRPIYHLIDIHNRVLDWIWQLTTVSMAAQVATFPLSLLYFHQFPTYFLLSNLFVIPLSTVVLVGGIFLLAISAIMPLASVTGMMLEWMVKLLNGIVYLTESLPMSVVDAIVISPTQCWLLFGMLVSLILVVELKSARWFYTSFGLGLVFSFLQWKHFDEAVDDESFIVYSIPTHYAVELIDHGQSYFECDSLLAADEQKIRFHIQPNRLEHGVQSVVTGIPSKTILGVTFFNVHRKTIAWITDKKTTLPSEFAVDYLIVSNNALNVKEMESVKNVSLILDGTNAPYYVTSLQRVAQKKTIHVTDGAFVLH